MTQLKETIDIYFVIILIITFVVGFLTSYSNNIYFVIMITIDYFLLGILITTAIIYIYYTLKN